MRVLKRKRLPGEPVCKDCNYPLDCESYDVISTVDNIDVKAYNITNKDDCRWAICNKCKMDYLIEGYHKWKRKRRGIDPDIHIDLSKLNIFRWFKKKKIPRIKEKNKKIKSLSYGA